LARSGFSAGPYRSADDEDQRCATRNQHIGPNRRSQHPLPLLKRYRVPVPHRGRIDHESNVFRAGNLLLSRYASDREPGSVEPGEDSRLAEARFTQSREAPRERLGLTLRESL
jgi:hypothetical protein